jgi:hypothetical protein
MIVITGEYATTLSPDRMASITRMRGRYDKLWKTVIDEGKTSGELRADLDTLLTLRSLLGMINWMFFSYRQSEGISAERIADQFASIVAPGLVP